MKVLKFCPMLTRYVTHEPIMVGHGAVTVPELYQCIGNQCGAYNDGFCNKYMTQVEQEVEQEEQDDK